MCVGQSQAEARANLRGCKRSGRVPPGSLVRLLRTSLWALALSACGGGGGSAPTNSNPPPPPAATLSPSATSFPVSASVTGQTPPPIAVTLTVINAVAGTTYYFGASYSKNGIASLAAQNAGNGIVTVYVSLKTPNTLAPGTHTDTVAFVLCQDQACKTVIASSEVTVAVIYTVTAVTGPQAPTAALAMNAVSAQALVTDTASTPISVALNLTNFNSVNPAVSVNTTTHGMANAGYSANFNEFIGGIVQISPQPGVSLTKGTYNDIVTVTVCLDTACVNPVGSPLTITVQYTVTNTETVNGPNGYTFQIVPQQTTDIAWDATHGRFYLSTPPDASNASGALRTLDPGTLTLGSPVSVGHQPTALGISDDGQFLYVGLADLSGVLRLQVPGLRTDLTIPLGPYQSLTQFAFDLAVAPGQPHSIALATTQAPGSSLGTAPLMILDDAVSRPNTGPVVSHMQWTADGSTLYAMGVSTNPQNLFTLAIGATGVVSTRAVTGYSQENPRVHLDQGLIYEDGGFVVDPTNGTLIHQLQSVYQVLPDSAHGKIFAYAYVLPGGFEIVSFDINTYAPIASVPVPQYVNNGVRLIRWGTNGLALTTDFGYVILISGPFVGP